MSSSPASPLPLELWSQVFKNFEFVSLLTASHVCRLIRSSAHAHPTFSRDIELLSMDNPEALNLFRLRLRIGKVEDRPISLNVSLGILSSDSNMAPHREVLAEIVAAMTRITDLDLKCSTAVSPELCAVLEARAPRLRSLKVTLLGSTEAFDYTVPCGFLSNNAPELHSIELVGLDFVKDGTRHTFPSVQRIFCPSTSLKLLPSLFPNLVDVVLGAPGITLKELDDAMRRFLLQVPQLTLYRKAGSLDGLGPTEAAIDFLTPRAEYTLQDAEGMRIVWALDRLEGDLEVQYSTLQGSNRAAHVFKVTSRDDGKVRMIIGTHLPYPVISDLLRTLERNMLWIVDRITHFSLKIGSPDEASAMTFVKLREYVLMWLPAMTDLTFQFGGNSESRKKHWPIYPVENPPDIYTDQLRRIHVVADTSQVLSHEDAEGLVVAALYHAERIGEVEIRVGTDVEVEASARQVLEANFLALNAAI